MATIPDETRRHLEAAGVSVARSVAEHLQQLATLGASVLWIPGAVAEAAQMAREAQRLMPSPAPLAASLSGTGCYGQAIAREIPDTPLDEWIAGVDALLAAHDQWQAVTDAVLKEDV